MGEYLHAFSVIPARYEHVPIWRTHGRYRKQMKRGYSKVLYNQRNKDETIMSVIKRLFGEHIMSRLTRTQNRELLFRCITYNMHRLTNLIILMFSTRPILYILLKKYVFCYHRLYHGTSMIHRKYIMPFNIPLRVLTAGEALMVLRISDKIGLCTYRTIYESMTTAELNAN